MVSPKIDLYKLKEEEWIKYKRMDKIATHETRMKQIILGALLTCFMLVLFLYAAIVAAPNISKAALLVHSAAAQLNSSFEAAGISNLTIHNNTALITTHLASNPHALASLVMWMFAVGTFLVTAAPLLVIAFLIFIIYMFVITMPFSTEIYSFESLRRRLASLEHIRNILRAHGFSEQEIDWYYEVKNEIWKLRIKMGE